MGGNLSLERGLTVLELFRTSAESIGVREIAREIALSPPAVQRILNTLAAKGFVEQILESRRYRLGRSILMLASHISQTNRVITAAGPELHLLAAQGCFNAFLGERRGSVGVYLLAVQSASPVVIRSTPGDLFPLHSTALGKALLMGMEAGSAQKILEGAPLKKLAPLTLTDPQKVVLNVKAAELAGYTTSVDENFAGVSAIGAPVRDERGDVVAGISVAFPHAVGPQVDLADVGEMVLAAGQRISTSMSRPSNVGSNRDGRHVA